MHDATGAPVIAWEEPFTTPIVDHGVNVARWDGNAWVGLGDHVVTNDTGVSWPSLQRDPTTGSLILGALIDNGLMSDFNGALVAVRWAGTVPWLSDYNEIPGFATRLAMGVTTETVYAALEANTFSPFESSINRWDAVQQSWHALPEFPSGGLVTDPAVATDGAALVVSALWAGVIDVKRWSASQWTSLCDGVLGLREEGLGRSHALAIDASGVATFAHLAERTSDHYDVVVRQGSAR